MTAAANVVHVVAAPLDRKTICGLRTKTCGVVLARWVHACTHKPVCPDCTPNQHTHIVANPGDPTPLCGTRDAWPRILAHHTNPHRPTNTCPDCANRAAGTVWPPPAVSHPATHQTGATPSHQQPAEPPRPAVVGQLGLFG